MDFLDFLSKDPGVEYTYLGTAYVEGKNHRAELKLKTLSVEEFGEVVSLRTSSSLTAGPLRYLDVCEEEIDRRGFREIRAELQANGKRTNKTLDSWTAIRPRFVQLGRKYPLDAHYLYGREKERLIGTELFLVESVPTELGTFECLRITSEFERTSDDKNKSPIRGFAEVWYARNFGIVRYRYNRVGGTSALEIDVTIAACSQDPIFEPVVVAKP